MATKLADEAGGLYNPSLRPLLVRTEVAAAVSLGGAAFDLAIVPLLLLRSTRPVALLVLTPAFHVANHFLWRCERPPFGLPYCSLPAVRARS